MVWENNFFFLLILNAITGNVAFGISALLIPIAQHYGCVRLIYNMLKGVTFFFVAPISYLLVKSRGVREVAGFLTGYDGNEVTAGLFRRIFLIWMIGSIVVGVIYLIRYFKYLRLRACNIPYSNPAVDRIFYGTYSLKRLKKVTVCQNFAVESPCIMGIFRPVLVMPECSYGEDELAVILAHEATHVVHRDNLWKCISLAIVIAIWWNPFLYLFLKMWEDWAETYCDVTVCRKFLDGDRKLYSGILLKATMRINFLVPPNLSHFGEKSSIKRRIRRLSKVKLNGRSIALSVVLSAVFLVGSGLTAFAAGDTAAEAGKNAYLNTFSKEVAGTETVDVIDLSDMNDERVLHLSPEEWMTDEYTMIQMEAEDGVDAASTIKDFDWDVPAKDIAASGNFLKTKDSTIEISCYITSSASVYVGVIGPDGTFHCIAGKGQVALTYTVSQFGYHKVAVQNPRSYQINAHGYYVR